MSSGSTKTHQSVDSTAQLRRASCPRYHATKRPRSTFDGCKIIAPLSEVFSPFNLSEP